MRPDRRRPCLAVRAAGLVAALLGTACGPAGAPESFKVDDPPPSPPDLAMPPPPRVGDGRIADAVAAALPAAQRGVAWSDREGNALSADWLLQSPPESHFGMGYAALPRSSCQGGEGCDEDLQRLLCYKPAHCAFSSGICTKLDSTVTAVGQAPTGRCTSHSDFLLEEVYRVIASAQHLVDVTSLSAPDGAFLGAMRNAVSYLASTGRPVTLRFLFGCVPTICPDVSNILAELTREVPADSRLSVHVAIYRSFDVSEPKRPSWNHSKIVAADGKVAIVGVDVYVVLSNPGALAGRLSAASGGGYGNGWTPEEVPKRVRDYLATHPEEGAPSGDALIDLVCRKLHVAPLRFSSENGFPDSDVPDVTPYPNHAKLVMVDDQAFYIGSQNLYPADLGEYGYLVDNQAAAMTLRSSYYAPLWQQSQRVAVSGTEAASCSLRRQME